MEKEMEAAMKTISITSNLLHATGMVGLRELKRKGFT